MTEQMTSLAPNEYDFLSRDFSQYTITLNLWRLTWDDMRAARRTAKHAPRIAEIQERLGEGGLDEEERAALEQEQSQLQEESSNDTELLDKAHEETVVTLTNGQQRRITDPKLYPFPVFAEAMRLFQAAMKEAMNPKNSRRG